MKTTKKISLISVLIILLGCVNIARADVCFLPDGASCAKGDTEGFWPCVGDDCPSPDGKCDASYNSNKSTNECGAACTRCSDSSSPYNGLYKCPENTCNCNEYTSTEAFNECGESCKVCRIAGDKNYGKYKCPAVPEWGCNPQCEDYTLTQEDECKDCDQCTNKNAPAEKQGLWKCTECDRNIYTQPIAELTSAQIANHCYENETCGCYMKCDSCFGKEFTMQDCQNAGYDSAKNECNGKRGTVYETCCNTCNGYIYSTDLSKTSEGWSCTECPNSCEGGSKYSCSCKTGYHPEGGNCVLNQCTSGVAENTCGTGYTFTSNNTSFTNTNGDTIRCGTCVKDPEPTPNPSGICDHTITGPDDSCCDYTLNEKCNIVDEIVVEYARYANPEFGVQGYSCDSGDMELIFAKITNQTSTADHLTDVGIYPRLLWPNSKNDSALDKGYNCGGGHSECSPIAMGNPCLRNYYPQSNICAFYSDTCTSGVHIQEDEQTLFPENDPYHNLGQDPVRRAITRTLFNVLPISGYENNTYMVHANISVALNESQYYGRSYSDVYFEYTDTMEDYTNRLVEKYITKNSYYPKVYTDKNLGVFQPYIELMSDFKPVTTDISHSELESDGIYHCYSLYDKAKGYGLCQYEAKLSDLYGNSNPNKNIVKIKQKFLIP